MGIKNGGQLLYSVGLTNINDLRVVLRHRNADSGRAPTVAFDANWLYYQFIKRKGKDAQFAAIASTTSRHRF